jgi:hypothetical protein
MSRSSLLRSVLVVLVALSLVSVAAAAIPRRTLADTQWRTWWGKVSVVNGAVTLSSQAPKAPAETHSALVTSAATWGDQTLSFTATTLDQLRVNSDPNVWETDWVMFHFRDLENYYWFMLKTNGWELGKKQGSDTQIFLATGDSPRIALRRKHQVQIDVRGPRIVVTVNGSRVVDFTDPNPIRSGSIGLYEEDARVRFEDVSSTATSAALRAR